jgi:putative ABC transport system ATP-binding protein
MGSSGSGKSTMMNILGCLDKPTDGTYLLDGIDVSRLSDNKLSEIRNKKIGFVFQSFNLLPKLTSIENVELPMVYGGIPAAVRHEKAMKALERVGLGKRVHHKPNELSGGQRQRVAIARALVNDPSIILADEPTGNLDSKSTIEIIDIFQQLNNEGATIVMVTHEPEVAVYTKRIVTFKDGKTISDELVENPIDAGGKA